MTNVSDYNPVNIVGFSTNPDKMSCSFLLTMYFSSSVCNNISAHSQTHIEYDRVINGIRVHVNFVTCSPNDENDTKNSKMYENGDTYALFIMLDNPKAEENFLKLLSFIKKNCSTEKKIYIIGVYKEKEKIIEKLNEENITIVLDAQRIYYELLMVDLNNKTNFVSIVDMITMEGLHNTKYTNVIGDSNAEEDYNADASTSGCLIF